MPTSDMITTSSNSISGSGRVISQLLPAQVGIALMYANFSDGTISTILMWGLYTLSGVAYISGMINTNNGIDFADTQTGFTEYSF